MLLNWWLKINSLNVIKYFDTCIEIVGNSSRTIKISSIF